MEGESNTNTVRLIEEAADIEMLKSRISSHPLYGVLVDYHMECLKMSLGHMEEAGENAQRKAPNKANKSNNLSDLDHFMQAYSNALKELKEAMKEPLQETTTFINNMHSQLKELMTTTPATTPTSSGMLDHNQAIKTSKEKITGKAYTISSAKAKFADIYFSCGQEWKKTECLGRKSMMKVQEPLCTFSVLNVYWFISSRNLMYFFKELTC
ncbi:hypothetical protein IFM89_020839 [Coptis chinensis]|uniref:Uncharacterized protein n=1 Tax=Coptis chinensis TaxID=261450 RepID=A0A835MA75_9MAGN|nr:hypothetical protein IFM89_020839 [Coptis chinensis]